MKCPKCHKSKLALLKDLYIKCQVCGFVSDLSKTGAEFITYGE